MGNITVFSGQIVFFFGEYSKQVGASTTTRDLPGDSKIAPNPN